MKIYIAGKITGDSGYREKFEKVAAELEARGNIALRPSALPEGMDRADYMKICFAMIDVADMVVFLPDMADSEGTLVELMYCRYIGKPHRIWEPVRQWVFEENTACGDVVAHCPNCGERCVSWNDKFMPGRCPSCGERLGVAK